MRQLARIPIWWAAVALLCAAAMASAQTSEQSTTTRMSRVLVWIVSPQNDPNPLATRIRVAQAVQPIHFQESTAGDFGRTAGATGQTAGSVGKTMGEFSQTAGSAGQTASSTGQTAGSFGKAAGSVGKNAGDAGTTMANFGTSTSDLPRVAAAKNGLIPIANQPRRDANWGSIADAVAFDPGLVYSVPQPLGVSYVDVYRNDLQALLDAAAGTIDTPDVLVGSPLPLAWMRTESGLAVRYGLAPLWNAPRFVVSEDSADPGRGFNPEAAVLATALNPDGARAYCLWLLDRDAIQGTYAKSPKTDPIAQLALRAMLSLLAGASVGVDGDAEMAQVSGSLAAAMFAGPRTVALENVKVHAEVTHLRVFGQLAFVTARATGNSAETFGVAHALVILRQDGAGSWKVLQVSPDIESRAQSRAWTVLLNYSTASARLGEEGSADLRNEGVHPLGVSQATPKDGEALSPQPELWWDNLGGATLQAVEWQQGTGEAWGASYLYFIPDNNARLRTRATARFASSPGQYRWRVWSVGTGGNVVLSPWRTMKIIGG